MKRYLLAFACLAIATASAGQTQKEDLIKELLKITGQDSLLAASLSKAVPQLVSYVQQQQGDTASRPDLEPYARMELGNAVHAFSLKEIVPAYDQRYSEEELKTLVDFLKSSAGRKYVRIEREMQESFMQESYKVMMVDLRELLKVKVQALMAAEQQKAEEEKAAREKAAREQKEDGQ
jgi:hypothetical protein